MSIEQQLLATAGSVLTMAGTIAKMADGPRMLLGKLGWDLPPAADDIGLAALELDRVGERLKAWTAAMTDPSATSDRQAETLLDLTLAVGDTIIELADLELDAPADYLDKTKIEDELVGRLFDLALIQAAATASRPTFDVAVLLGWFELTPLPADPAIFQVAHTRHTVHWDRIPMLLTDPEGLLREVYGWGTPTYDANKLVANLGAVLQHIATGARHRALPAVPLARLHGGPPPDHEPLRQLFLPIVESTGPVAGEAGLSVFGLPPTTAGGADGGLGVAPYAAGTLDLEVPLSTRLLMTIAASAELAGGVALVLRPDADPDLRVGLDSPIAGTAPVGGRVEIGLSYEVPGDANPVTLVATSGATVTARKVALILTVLVGADGAEASVRAVLAGGKAAIVPDGLPFIGAVIPDEGLVADVDLEVSWSSRSGVRVDGRAELSMTRPIDRRIGPLTLRDLRVALATTGDDLALTVGLGVTVFLGPVQIVVDGLGLRAALGPGPGTLGSADLGVEVARPTGLGFRIDSSLVSGGGFFFADPDGHTYAGVIDLRFEKIAVKALGVLDTDTGAAPGWSLLLLLFAELTEPIPIGFGFSLSGFGGIVGLSFGVSVDELRAAMGSGAFDDVLFPANPIADAPRILGRLRSFFPVTPGALLIGPAVEITWGGKVPLVTARLAVLVQIANVFGAGNARFDRLVVLGTIRAVAPPGDLPVPPTIQLVADLLGSYDAQTGLLAIDAQLRDSVVAGVEVGGTVIIRVGLGSNPAFALSAGGFHPDFTDLPPNLPARIDRISLSWKAGGAASISLSLQAYVALTASTIQLGAAFDLVAKVGPVSLDGHLGFDLLIAEDRSFSAHIEGRVAIRYRGRKLAGVGLDMVLSRSAENIWRVRGTATFEILWWDVDVDFDDSWGEPAALPRTRVAVAELVRAALADVTTWSVAMPGGGESLVTLAAGPSESGGVLAHPLGRIRITQTVAPLDLELDHLDDADIDGDRHVSVTAARIGPTTGTPDRALDPFTRARYQRLSEAERLAAPSFEAMPSGCVVGEAGFVAPAGVGVGAGHETRLFGPPGEPPPPPSPPLFFPAEWLGWQLGLAAAAESPLRAVDSLRPAVSAQFEVLPMAYVGVTPGTIDGVPLDPAVARCRPLAEQAAARAGLRLLEAHEL